MNELSERLKRDAMKLQKGGVLNISEIVKTMREAAKFIEIEVFDEEEDDPYAPDGMRIV